MRNIVASGGGINWCWYHWLTINDDRTVTEERSDRFHRFDEWQGAEQHPVWTHRVNFYHERGCTPEYWAKLTGGRPVEAVVMLDDRETNARETYFIMRKEV